MRVLSCLYARITTLTPLALMALLMWPTYAPGQSIDENAAWTANYQAIVHVKVFGNRKDGNRDPIFGSGVIIGPDGEILTALHVVGDDSDWDTTTGGRPDRTIEVFSLDRNGNEQRLGEATARPLPGVDIALLFTNGSCVAPAIIASLQTEKERRVTSGIAFFWEAHSHLPKPVSVRLAPADKARYADKLTVSRQVLDGYSGSGIFDADNKLVAIITNKDEFDPSESLAIPVRAFSQLLPPKLTIQAPPPLKEDRVAILPFRNVSNDSSIGNLSLELPLALHERLYQHLSLASTNSCMAYREQQARDVGKGLNAGTMIAGSYWLSDQELNVHLEIVDTAQDRIIYLENFKSNPSSVRSLILEQMVQTIEAVLHVRSEAGKIADTHRMIALTTRT